LAVHGPQRIDSTATLIASRVPVTYGGSPATWYSTCSL